MAREVGVTVQTQVTTRNSSSANENRRKEVEDFLLRPDISYTMPGKYFLSLVVYLGYFWGYF